MKQIFSTISFIFCCALFTNTPVFAQAKAAPNTFTNPVISGFYPDPSITRVGEDYYLATSSFEWFPAVPIFHSKDLVNWQKISYAVSEPSYLPELADIDPNRGIYAPTLRYHDGLFYLITTCVRCGDNFYVTAEDPRGPWSKPIWVQGDRGIDPDLFWDDDGKVYYTGTGILDKSQAPWKNANGIWTQEIDLKTGKLLGKKTQLTFGHAAQAHYTEGPHIYKIDGKYLLMVAEGGTGSSHAVSVFRADKVTGPYEPFQNNPVMTHRNMGWGAFIHTTGHADLVQTQNGDWWAVMLAKRNFKGKTMLARETYLTPVQFQKGWPIFNPGKARVLEIDKRPKLPWSPLAQPQARDEFKSSQLNMEFNFLRIPTEAWYKTGNGKLALDLRPETGRDNKANPSMVVRRIKDLAYQAQTKLDFSTNKGNEKAGLVIYRNKDNWYEFVKTSDSLDVRFWRKGKLTQVASTAFKAKQVVLKVESNSDLKLTFSYGQDEHNLSVLADEVNADATSDNIALGFNGPYVGMYATSSGSQSNNQAKFDWFEYRAKDNVGQTMAAR
ncbi:glycoside hydrolase 43 family protein [Saccharobesus litoralis]|uniref:Glycoside hydrolase 43 family protein n=1 Tax=Saccharobesus litoralis TaxID=2172099 RepID=A0A2S0VMX1_9ALTE|nr:glycoside hydrolase family 43 protein [Saccharobesus litoralis]AWB65555.1 glycoside hydrolase 43 family protein [Saccharobesus litoralis]